jgi:hypothetical protein
MTTDHAVRGAIRGSILAVLLGLILAACAGPGAGSSGAPSAPPSDAPIDLPTSAPSTTLTFEDLAGRLAELDGSTVSVTGYLLISGDRAQFCGVLLESYPPQCGAVTFRVIGEVPAAVLDGLDTTTEADIDKAWWGLVTITGQVAADGGDGSPTITIESIELAEAG